MLFIIISFGQTGTYYTCGQKDQYRIANSPADIYKQKRIRSNSSIFIEEVSNNNRYTFGVSYLQVAGVYLKMKQPEKAVVNAQKPGDDNMAAGIYSVKLFISGKTLESRLAKD